jgi:membrane protein implicated in regulation of membrane protease activity
MAESQFSKWFYFLLILCATFFIVIILLVVLLVAGTNKAILDFITQNVVTSIFVGVFSFLLSKLIFHRIDNQSLAKELREIITNSKKTGVTRIIDGGFGKIDFPTDLKIGERPIRILVLGLSHDFFLMM